MKFIIAPTQGIGVEAPAPFVVIRLDAVTKNLVLVRKALEVLRGVSLPQVSIYHGSIIAFGFEQLEKLLALDEVAEAKVIDVDEGELEALDAGEHYRDADVVRIHYHDDGDAWLTILPKEGSQYEADLSPAIKPLAVSQ